MNYSWATAENYPPQLLDHVSNTGPLPDDDTSVRWSKTYIDKYLTTLFHKPRPYKAAYLQHYVDVYMGNVLHYTRESRLRKMSCNNTKFHCINCILQKNYVIDTLRQEKNILKKI